MRGRDLRRIAAVAALVLGALALGATRGQEPLRIVHASWSSSVASAHVIAEAIEARTGRRVDLSEAPVDEAWAAVAEGRQDAFLSAWLPSTHQPYLERFGEEVLDLGPNLEGTRTGLMVPDVASSRQTGPRGERGVGALETLSIADLAEHGDRYGRRIVGIEEEAGVMRQTREAMSVYGLEDWELVVTAGEQAMLRHLEEAIRAGRPIVVTGWVPLWAHGRWSLTFLRDPEGVYGGTEAIHTVVRPGLRDEMPDVTEVLDAFAWSPEEMHLVMTWMQDAGAFPRDAARRWISTHGERVASWFEE